MQQELDAYKSTLLGDPFLARRLTPESQRRIAAASRIDEAAAAYNDAMSDVLGFAPRGGGRTLFLDLADVVAGPSPLASIEATDAGLLRVAITPSTLAAIVQAYGPSRSPRFMLNAGEGEHDIGDGLQPLEVPPSTVCAPHSSLLVAVPVTFPPGLEARLKGVTLSTAAFAADADHARLARACRAVGASR